jgi:membrane-associated phospholipid phosphatase
MKLFSFLTCALFGCACSPFLCATEPIFQYDVADLQALAELSSDHTMSLQEVQKWDAIASRAVEENHFNFYEGVRFFTYLYVAQNEAITLTNNLNQTFKGSLDPISYQVTTLFFPEIEKTTLFNEDPFSLKLAEMILTHIAARVEKENSLHATFFVPLNLKQDFSAGLDVAKWTPWFAKPEKDYWPAPPPSIQDPIWQKQIAAIKNAQNPMTEEKKRVIFRWAGLAYPGSSDFREIANQYFLCHDVPLKTVLLARSIMMIGLYDCVIAYTSCKYHYLFPRPQKLDPTVVYIIPVPKHPSYPSGHATESTVVARILSHFFPQDSHSWENLGQICRNSRIWAGIHYPIDNEAGIVCGNKVADTILTELTN